MMTIKHKPENGPEVVVTAVSTSYDEKTGVLVGHGTPNGDVSFNSGHAFVMNDVGKTVAAYNLRPKQ